MDDLISRSDAIGAVKEERFPIDSDYAEGFMAALDKVEWILKEWLPSAQPETHEERTETHACDYISRQAAIDILYKNYILGRGDLNEVLDHIVDRLDKLPSAEPRKKGRWIKKTIKKKIENDYSCSECGRHVSVMRGYDVRMVYPFCHCGADMTEGEG